MKKLSPCPSLFFIPVRKVMKQKELLRGFDPQRALAGEEICWSHLDKPVCFVGMVPDGRVVVNSNGRELLEVCSPLSLRMTPLFWHEDKPVYKGDRLWHNMVGDWVVVKGLQGQPEAAKRGWFTTETSFYDVSLCNWEEPKKPVPLAMLNNKPIFPGTRLWHVLSGGVVTIQSKSSTGDLVDSNGVGRSLCYLRWKKDRVGYSNVYSNGIGSRSLGCVKPTLEEAEANASSGSLGIARVTWEEDL